MSSMNSSSSTTSEMDSPGVDLDAGTQPADINAIGTTASRFPLGKVLFFVAVLLLVLTGLFFLGKYWILAKWNESAASVRKPEQSTAPSEAAVSQNRPRLPDANTPLSDSPLADSGIAVTGASRATNAGTATPSGAIDSNAGARAMPSTACTTSALVDKRSGQTVRDAQGQSVMVDCNGKIVGGSASMSIPPPAAGQFSPGVPASTIVDRYSGDTALGSSRKANASTGAGSASMSIPPPPVSSAQLEERFKNILAASSAGNNNSNNANPILAQGTAANTPPNAQGRMGGLLTSTSTPKALALRTFDPNLTVPKGDAVDCNMTTRVVTEISGFTSCIVSNNVYSANGKVLLIERMSEIQGEYAAVGQPGQRRVYVLWSRIRKPGGITIDIDSPSTDTLGAAGIEGIVDNRWFERIGSAYMLSIFKDFLAAQAAGTAGGSSGGINAPAGTALYQNSINTSTSLAEKVLSQSINIKPVVYAHQGERVSIYVARDLDFSGIYQVKTTAQQP